MKRKINFIIIILAINFLFVFSVKGAEVSFDKNYQEMLVNQEFKVSIVINTNNETINAIEGEIILPSDILTVKMINDANSIINLWIEKPQIRENKIKFSGIIPGGYKGKQGLLMELFLKTKREGKGTITFQNVKMLKNDGFGTEAPVNISDFIITIKGEMPPNQIIPLEIIDNNPPEPFTPIISQDPAIFNGKYFLVFSTQDKESGIDHYEVREGRGHFVKAKSPYLIKNQELNEEIIVKAIDKKGNERLSVVKPLQKKKAWYTEYKTFIIILITIIVIALTLLYSFKKYVNQKK